MESPVAGALSLGSRRHPPPRPPRTPRRRRPAHARKAGPETCPIRRHTSGPRPSVRPIDLRESDPIRYPPSSPCSRVGRARSSDRWLALRPRKLSCGANRPRDAGAEESGCRSNKRARRVASPLTCGPLSRRATGGLKTDGNFPFFPAPFSTFYRPVSVFSFRNPDEIQNGGCRDMDGSRNNVFPSVFSESRISSELFRI
jgi:hypothetical protein